MHARAAYLVALIAALGACDRAQRSAPASPAVPAVPGAIEAPSPELARADIAPVATPGSDGTADHADCSAHEVERAAAYETRIADLEAELQALARERIEREREWLVYTQTLARLGTAADLPVASFQGQAEDPELAATPAALPQVQAVPALTTVETAPPAADRIARAREIDIALRSLFTIEQVTGLDLLESGALGAGCIGPVVLRVLDDGGRPIGSLCADRLRFECSRAARTLTLVLEHGYERRAGSRVSFSGLGEVAGEEDPRDGDRRILLPDIDPTPWVEALPELFGDEAKDASQDDGRWDLRALRAALNQLLREDASGGYYRVQGLAGVQGVVVRDVQLYHLDREGRLERRLFADRMMFLTQVQGIQILLEDGAQVRGDRKSPFLDGRYRIFLPSAEQQAWADAGIPGLSPEPERARQVPADR